MLYARSDVMALSLGDRGCGATHSRPVTHGAPAKTFKLDCQPCETHLRGDGQPKKLVYQTDQKTGNITHQERVPDASPMWSSTPDTVPLTPDEARTNAVRQERGAMQIQMLQALAAIRSTGVDVPAEAMWLLEREIPETVLKGSVICANSHDVPAGSAFCPQCGIEMKVRAAVEAAPSIPLTSLHVATLRKMCREKKLPDNGTKDSLIERIMAA